jgi:hypothetical protein
MLALADGAILFARAALFRLVAHHANDGTGHGSLQGKLYLTMTMRGKARLRRLRPVINSLSQIRFGLLLLNAGIVGLRGLL